MLMSYCGGCACGLVKYECSAEPVMSVNCHCRDCQQASGSAYSADIIVPISGWKLLCGSPNFYEKKAHSGNTVTRAFCGDCGSPLFVKEVAIPDIVTVNVGSLDDPSRYSPSGDWWTSSAQPWDHMNPKLEKFTTQPEV
ncbi:MAG: hypothetical protein ACI9BW_004065 [Gammaproteobacteria bacterium]|jgi:hypothetical protein